MRGFRETLIEERPFRAFQLHCSECNEVLIELSDLTESPFKNEVLVLHRIENHAKESGHYSFDGDIKPHGSLHHIDTTITVNDNV
jgi:hypothetical protein